MGSRRPYWDICKVGKWNVTRFGAHGARLEWGYTEIELKLETDLSGSVVEPSKFKWCAEPRYRRKMTRDEWRAECEEERRERPESAHLWDPESKRIGPSSFDTPPHVKAEAEHVIRWLCENRPALFCRSMESHWSKRAAEYREWAGRSTGEKRAKHEADLALSRRLGEEWSALCDRLAGIEEEQPPPEHTFTTEEGRSCTLSATTLVDPGLLISIELDPMVVTINSGNGPEPQTIPRFARVLVALTSDGQLDGGELYEAGWRLAEHHGCHFNDDDDAAVYAYAREHGEALIALSGARTRNKRRRDDHLHTPDTSGYVRPKGGFR